MANEWRNHPQLVGRFHSESPDDLQVIVHDGGPRMTDRRPEAVWVRVLAARSDLYEAEVLNQPQQLATVKQGDRIQFVIPSSGKSLIMVRQKYLNERSAWIISPCNKCGASELLDAPSDLIAKTFPDLNPGDVLEAFTAFCGICGGVQSVQLAVSDADGADVHSTPRKWWQFWH